MAKLLWDQVGDRRYEAGVDQGVLYVPNNGVYDNGYAWNGLTAVTEAPSGADANPIYADNIKYLNLIAVEEFGATIEALTYPDEFAQCDGSAEPQAGVALGQQSRKSFGLSYRTKVSTDANPDAGYKYHLVYGCQAAPSQKAYATINDKPDALKFSWTITTTPVAVNGYKSTAILTVDSTKANATDLQALTDALYGTAGANPRLPLPNEVLGMFTGSVVSVTPTAPTYDAPTHVITIPTITGVTYRRTDTEAVVTGTITLTTGQSVVIRATPNAGYTFPANTDTDWQYNY